jgi:hypothetical protein
MRTMKAVVIPQPRISKIAAGEISVEIRRSATEHRGPILLVSAESPRIEPAGYAIAVAELVGCSPRDEGYAWSFDDVRPVMIFPAPPGKGVFDVRLPADGLRILEAVPFSPVRPRHRQLGREHDGSLPTELAVARDALMRATAHAPREAVRLVDELRVTIVELMAELADAGSFFDPPAGLSRGTASRALARPLGLALSAPELEPPRLDVLVVDPSELVGRSLQRSLDFAHLVRAVRTPEAGAREIRHRVPDVVVCEYQDGTDDLLATLGQRYPEVWRVLFSSAPVLLSRRLMAARLIDVPLPKPASRQRLLAALLAS